ncbi:MAG: ARMT1-like domain-containing protein [Candidatus Saelkia tenebricola]|nr:ARMT1-like domain-containing protein [Candidatus Saelkia tenebricola]
METYLECIPCLFKQSLLIADKVNLDDDKKRQLIKSVCGLFMDEECFKQPPPVIAKGIYEFIYQLSGVKDVFRQEKKDSTQEALSFYYHLRRRVNESTDPLLEAIRISILGNIIDFGALCNFNLENEIKIIDQKHFAVFDYQNFKDVLDKADSILYIADNAGECVFDKVLIETLGKKIFYAVRSKPIINDATFEDAKCAGIDEVAEIVDSGSELPGILLDNVNPKFLSLFRSVPLIISKGQGNFETLSDVEAPLFFLLQAKCSLVSRMFSCEIGDFILSCSAKRMSEEKKEANSSKKLLKN